MIKFALFFGRSPDLASPEDLRAFQLQLVEAGVSSTTINATITGLKFFFDITLERPTALKRMSRVRKPQKLPQVLSVKEVERLLAGASNPKHRAALAVAYGAGLRASEVVHLKVTDIDSERMIVRVEQGKGQSRPLRHAVTRLAGVAASLVAARPCSGQDAAWRLVVPGTQPGEATVDPATQYTPVTPRCASCRPRQA